MSFSIIPAIDLLDGSCVRLKFGDFEQCKVYDLDAVRLARQYAEEGAQWLHVVDLAASRDGEKADTRPLLRLLESAPQKVQTGGGGQRLALDPVALLEFVVGDILLDLGLDLVDRRARCAGVWRLAPARSADEDR